MAFDGIVVANLVHELKEQLLNGRIAKIAQPEADELLLTIKSPKGQRRLFPIFLQVHLFRSYISLTRINQVP
mgnify:CR=1 FL=1